MIMPILSQFPEIIIYYDLLPLFSFEFTERKIHL